MSAHDETLAFLLAKAAKFDPAELREMHRREVLHKERVRKGATVSAKPKPRPRPRHQPRQDPLVKRLAREIRILKADLAHLAEQPRGASGTVSVDEETADLIERSIEIQSEREQVKADAERVELAIRAAELERLQAEAEAADA